MTSRPGALAPLLATALLTFGAPTAQAAPVIRVIETTSLAYRVMDVDFEYTDDDPTAVHTVTFDWGDGTVDVVPDATPGAYTLSHQFDPDADLIDGTLTIDDGDGNVAEGTTHLYWVDGPEDVPVPFFVFDDFEAMEGATSVMTAEVGPEYPETLAGYLQVYWEFQPDFTHDDPFDDAYAWALGDLLEDPPWNETTYEVEAVYNSFHADGPSEVPVRIEVCYFLFNCRYGEATVTVHNQDPGVWFYELQPYQTFGRLVSLEGFVLDTPLDTVDVTIGWGDGTESLQNLYGQDEILGDHTYDASGDYTLTLHAVDDDGGETTQTVPITVDLEPEDLQPGGPYAVDEGSSVTLSGSAVEPDGEPITYKWDFGADGTIDATGASATFAAVDGDDSVPVVFYACDEPRCATASTTIEVANVAPNNLALSVAGNADLSADLVITFTDAGTADTHEVEIDWGDGAGTSDPSPIQSGDTVSHVYDIPGEYDITVTVRDDDGGAITATTATPWVGLPPTCLEILPDPESGKRELKTGGQTPAVLCGSEWLDVADIDLTTIRIAGWDYADGHLVAKGNGAVKEIVQDFTGDGIDDVKVFLPTEAVTGSAGSEDADVVLVGQTFGGVVFLAATEWTRGNEVQVP